MAIRRAYVALRCRALTAIAVSALSVVITLIGCADLTRPDAEPRPDPATRAASVTATKLAVLERPSPVVPKALDVVPLDPAPGRLHDFVPSSANPAPAAAAGGGGG